MFCLFLIIVESLQCIVKSSNLQSSTKDGSLTHFRPVFHCYTSGSIISRVHRSGTLVENGFTMLFGQICNIISLGNFR